jgi:Na+/melibiose symporter-like transporter
LYCGDAKSGRGQSIKADVIDWDEAETGERKEGSYFAAWNLADKAAGVLSVGLVGFFIQGPEGGVDPDGVRFVMSYLPAGFMMASMLILAGFRLDAEEHKGLRARIASSAA